MDFAKGEKTICIEGEPMGSRLEFQCKDCALYRDNQKPEVQKLLDRYEVACFLLENPDADRACQLFRDNENASRDALEVLGLKMRPESKWIRKGES